MENNRIYRIRTTVGSEKPFKIDVPLTQTYDMFEILSLKLKQKNEYNFYDADYGIIVGRVLANGNFGIPNAKVSVFIEVDADESVNKKILYNFTSAQSSNLDGVRYNLLPDFVDNACHQDVGTFPNKRLVLDNNDVLEIFDKYYKYTTVTNESGDYMIFGVPTGMQNVHVDIDMSDIGKLSQRPRDMVYKGYNINQFESPNKFKQSTNLNSLAQLYTQDKGVFVYSYWGNSNNQSEDGNDHIAITRCDFQIEYKFEPTCVFIGSIVTDKGANAIGKNCTGTDNVGKMSDLSAGEGTIEMIRKTVDGKVEEFQIKGNRLIDGDGVWCYQIPMNLDYVMTDEFGNIVPTDDPSKGIPTRTRVRFRISLDESPNDATARKRCRFLVPNNPRYDEVDYPQFYSTKEADYEFGSATREESYCDMFWNNVYTVKSYIPRLQKNRNSTNRKHTGIKLINHYGDNNPMPYNSLSIKLSFTYRLICVLVKVLIWIIATINTILATVMEPICWIAKTFLTIAKGLCFSILGIKPLCWLGAPFKALGKAFEAMVVKGITLGSSFCDDGINRIAFYPILFKGFPCVLDKVKKDFNKEQNGKSNPEERERLKIITITSMDNNELITCIENNLAQSNDATSFNFQNDWINGVLYAPLWYRKITPKRSFFFGLIKRKAKDQWCRSDGNFNLMMYQACALDKTSTTIKSPVNGNTYRQTNNIIDKCGKKCHEKKTMINVNNGLILTKETMLGQTVYYYKAVDYNRQLSIKDDKKDGVILLFATDIVLLGSLNDCDINGIPQFFKSLESTTYNLPTDILFTDTIIQVDSEGKVVVNGNNDIVYEQFTEATGCDWGNLNTFDECGKMGKDTDSGLFYGIGCSSIEMTSKSCLNLSRICEYGVSLDEAKDVPDLNKIQSSDGGFERLTPDGFVSFDELININERSMFATLNGNRLRTRLNNKNGLKEYDLRYLYTDNFDGLMKGIMRKSGSNCNYTNNHNMERMCDDYYMFRMGTEPYFYDENLSLPRYENSFYFYFGLKMGKTAIDKFNSQFFASCEDSSGISSPISIEVKPNSWCTDDSEGADGYVLIDLSNVSLPCDIILNSEDNSALGFNISHWTNDKIFIGKYKNLSDKDKEEVSTYVGEHYDINLWDKTDQDNPNEIEYIPNGNYELVITDSEGQIISYKFSMMPQRVQFTYNRMDNEIPNNQRLSENADYKTLFENIKNENKSDYGGYIELNSIIDNFDDFDKLQENEIAKYYLVAYDYDISSVSGDSEKNFIDGYGGSLKLGVNKKGVIKSMEVIGDNYKALFNDGIVFILTPLGNVDYNVSITEICKCEGCEDIDMSNNTCTYTIRINDTLPFKLFVNDIDVETFKNITGDIWKIGWDASLKPDISNLGKGWLNLSADIEDFDEYYDITKIEGYEQIEDEISQLKDEYDNYLEQLRLYTVNVNNAKITINDIEYDQYVTVEGVNYGVKDGKVTINGNEYHIKDDKVTIDGENTIIRQFINVSNDGNLRKNDLTDYYITQFILLNDIQDKVYTVVTVKEATITINGIKYDQYVTVEGVNYGVKDGKVTINGIEYEVEDGKLTIDYVDKINYIIDEIKEKALENQQYDKNVYQINYVSELLKETYKNCFESKKVYKEGIDDNNINSVKNKFKLEFLKLVKETFWLTSETQPKDITITVQTKKLPIEYYLKYCPEENSDETEANVLGTNGNVYPDDDTEVYSVSDILIPTITNSDNENYGFDGNDNTIKLEHIIYNNKKYYVQFDEKGKKYVEIDEVKYFMNDKNEFTIYDQSYKIEKNNISFGYDREHGYDKQRNEYRDLGNHKWVKKPYGIRIKNGKGDKLPINGNVTLANEKYFFFHIIDKVLKFKMVGWSYIKDIPYPPTASPFDRGRSNFINLTGLVAGEIHNGILPFTNFKLGKYSVNNVITHTKDNENSIPTRRYINEFHDTSRPEFVPVYPGYKVEGEAGTVSVNQNYIPVSYKQEVLNIEDSSTYVSESIYGNMSIELVSNTTNGKKLDFKFNVRNGDNSGQTKIILIKHSDTSKYPLSYLTPTTVEHIIYNNKKYYVQLDEKGKKYVEIDGVKYFMNDKNEFTIDDQSYETATVKYYSLPYSDIKNKIMDYNTTFADLCQLSQNSHFIERVGIVNDEGEDKDVEFPNEGKKGETSFYSTNGHFELHGNNTRGQRFFAIAVTENNFRALSPLYEFKAVDIHVNLVTLKTLIETSSDTETTYEIMTDYKVGTKIVNSKPYYLEYYPYKVNMDLYINDNLKIQEEVTVKAGVNQSLFDIKEENYKILASFFNPMSLPYLISKTNVTYKDCTNLTLMTNKTHSYKETLYGRQWIINDGFEMEDETKIKVKELKLNEEVPELNIVNAISSTDNELTSELNSELMYYQNGDESIKLLTTVKPLIYNKHFVKWQYTYTEEGGNALTKDFVENMKISTPIIIKPVMEDVIVTFSENGGQWSNGNISHQILTQEHFVAEMTDIPFKNTDIEKWEFSKWSFDKSSLVEKGINRLIKGSKVCCAEPLTVYATYKKFGVSNNYYTIKSPQRYFTIDVQSVNENGIFIPYEINNNNTDIIITNDESGMQVSVATNITVDKTWFFSIKQKETDSEINIIVNYVLS